MASSCSRSKTPPVVPALPVCQQSRQPVSLVASHPAIDGIGVAHPQQAMAGDPIGGVALSDFQHSRTPLPHIRAWVMVALGLQCVLLAPTQFDPPSRSHLTLLLSMGIWLHENTTDFGCQSSLGPILCAIAFGA
jgi:hypothetical protein